MNDKAALIVLLTYIHRLHKAANNKFRALENAAFSPETTETADLEAALGSVLGQAAIVTHELDLDIFNIDHAAGLVIDKYNEGKEKLNEQGN